MKLRKYVSDYLNFFEGEDPGHCRGGRGGVSQGLGEWRGCTLELLCGAEPGWDWGGPRWPPLHHGVIFLQQHHSLAVSAGTGDNLANLGFGVSERIRQKVSGWGV